MERWSIETLDFPKIKEKIMEYTASYLGRQRVEQMIPTDDFDEVDERLAETREGMDLIRLKGEVPLRGISHIQPSLQRAKVNGVLSSEELLNLANTIRAGRVVKNWVRQIDERKAPLSRVRKITEQIVGLRELEEQITACIDDQGLVVDHASRDLKKIREQIETLRDRIQRTLQQMLHQPHIQKMLQESIVTQRQNRYVLPVKQEYRNAFKGIIHDQSSSGATLFIEPESIVFLNNQMQEKELEEQREIEKILKQLTQEVRQQIDALTINIEALAHLDLIVAKARFASQFRATCPILSPEPKLQLKKARHPLLSQEKVVPIDVTMDPSQQGIIITGPNTGGKTVTLKTVGLLALMTQSGFPIPVEEESIMPVFSGVFADIGDEQSIEQSLSTFSGHMKNTIHILQQIDHRSLVLFDEIGAGTDPTEGSALAIAILEYVLKVGSYVIATTHYSELKLFAHSHHKTVNASMEFDVATLKPTYRLLMGVPGQSHAFAIADRLGLTKEITQRAREGISKESQVLEEMIASLREEQKKASLIRQEAEQYHMEAENLYQEIRAKIQLWEEEKQQIKQKARNEAKQIVVQTQKEAEEILKEMRSWAKQKNALVKEHQWTEAKKRLSHLMVEEENHDQEFDGSSDQELQIHDEVYVLPYQQKGTVIERIDDRHLLVQVGPLKMKVKQGQLKKKESSQPVQTQPMIQHKTNTDVRPELDIRGKMVEEALPEIDKYLDRALLSGYSQVFLIHGKGTGALRTGIHKFLRKHRFIQSFRLGSHGEGGSGVTVVQLNDGNGDAF